MTFSPDLDRYFARIGDSGSRAPTLGTLDRIIEAHARTIPFENLDVLLDRGISLEPADIERKLVQQERGGYCFEQNTLLLHVLSALGFQVQPISARVRIRKPRSVTPARTHMFLRVELDGQSRLVDVGAGGLTPTSSLELILDTLQTTPHEPRRIVTSGAWTDLERRAPDACLYHQVRLNDTWEDLYDFTLEEMHPIDRTVSSWYTSTHPDSHFRSHVLVARPTQGGRLGLWDRELTRRDVDGRSVTRTLETHDEVLAVLHQEFGLRFPAGTRFACLELA